MIESNETKPEETPESSPAEAVSIDPRIQELELQVKEKENKYLYLYADFENYKKRAIKERSDLQKFGWESVARDLLQALDNLDRALDHTPPNSDKNWVDGLQMSVNHFKAVLEKQGVRTIETLAKPFDPNLHEAVSQEKSDLPPGTITKEHLRGYTLHGRLLRPAQVTVSDH